jgi:putative transposase
VPAPVDRRVRLYHLVFDACANGHRLTSLTVIDGHTRACLAIDVAGSARRSRVIELLAKLVTVHSAQVVRSNYET